MRYLAYGHTLDTDLPLQDLVEAAAVDTPPDLQIQSATHQLNRGIAADLPSAPDAPWMRLSRNGDRFVLDFEGGGSFTLSGDGSAISVHLGADGFTDTLHHLLLDQVIPLALAHRGRLVVHGSALVIEDRCVAFVGPAGAGKSTLAASFGRHGRLIVADDALVTALVPGGVVVEPAYPGLRVWPEVLESIAEAESSPYVNGYSEKRRLGVQQGFRFSTTPELLDRLYLVQTGEAADPVVARIGRRSAAIALLTHTFVLDPADARRLTDHLEQACALVERIAVRTLSFPRDFARLDDVRRAVHRDLTS